MSDTVTGVNIRTWIDNRPGNSLLEAIGRLMREAQTLDIATGFFEIGSFVDLDGHWQHLRHVRLLMGDELNRSSKQAFLQALRRRDGIDRIKARDDWVALKGLEEIVQALVANQVEARVYTRAKFHAKAYHFYTPGVVDHAIVGSSNFTHPGLTQNLELNHFTSDSSHLRELADWYQKAWDEAEPIKEELLEILEPHVRAYHPFEVYIKAMRERFLGLEPDGTSWEVTESAVYPLLAKYQKDAYFDLMHMAKTWGGGLLCDGVGLGKTFVGLMLIERARRDRHKVLVIAPNAAIPSVWERNLFRFFPEDYGRFTDDIRVMAHTDFGRQGGVSDEDIEKLRRRYDTIIVDEAHHFRNTNRNRSIKLKALAEGKRLFLLTATPVNNSLIDLYNLINYIAQDNQRKFATLGIPHLRRWFGEREDVMEPDQLTLDLHDTPDFQQFLKHIIVQRSRTYVKGIEKDFDQNIRFPVRQRPEVVEYSLGDVYGKQLLPQLLDALDPKKPKLTLAIYETEKYKQTDVQAKETIDFQSNVVSLIRTMLLKRLESSEVALEASVEDLLMKHLVVLTETQPIKAQAWIADFQDVHATMIRHRHERLGGDEEEDEIPLTPFEGRKIAEIKSALNLFGTNLEKWQAAIENDMAVLGKVLRELHQKIGPSNDAKLQAFLTTIRTTRLGREKFVVFSEFKDTARYLEEQLKAAFPDESVVEVDSGRNVKGREVVIRRFSPHYNCVGEKELADALKDPIRILISTDVLSEGLNLQDANIIVNYDLHWNPVRLMQRIGRVDRRMDPSKPVDYDKVYVYNFLCPKELDDIIHLNSRITGKLLKINRALGIEAPVLNPDDEHQVMDFYLNLGEGQMSEAERLRRLALQLERDHPELWERAAEFPTRIYSGKSAPGISNIDTPQSKTAKRLFLCYNVVSGFDTDLPLTPMNEGSSSSPDTPPRPSTLGPSKTPLYDTRWILIDPETGEIEEGLEAIHAAIECAEGTPRRVELPESERTKLRKLVEDKVLAEHRYRARISSEYEDKLLCWMEV